jgi:hypothetical protein
MRVVRVRHTERVKRKDQHGEVSSSKPKVRLVVPPEDCRFLATPYTGLKNLTKVFDTDREYNEFSAEWIARFKQIRRDAKARRITANSPLNRVLAMHPDLRDLTEIADFVAEEGGENPFIAEPKSQHTTDGPVIFETMVELWACEKKGR